MVSKLLLLVKDLHSSFSAPGWIQQIISLFLRASLVSRFFLISSKTPKVTFGGVTMDTDKNGFSFWNSFFWDNSSNKELILVWQSILQICFSFYYIIYFMIYYINIIILNYIINIIIDYFIIIFI